MQIYISFVEALGFYGVDRISGICKNGKEEIKKTSKLMVLPANCCWDPLSK